MISTAPFAFRKGDGYVVAFRYGAAVLIGLDPDEEEESLRALAGPGRARRARAKKSASGWNSRPARKKA